MHDSSGRAPRDLSSGAHAQRIPPAKEGFIRSRALQFQIYLLSEQPDIDHFLVGWHATAQTSGLILPEPHHKMTLRKIRNRALYDGDRVWVQGFTTG